MRAPVAGGTPRPRRAGGARWPLDTLRAFWPGGAGYAAYTFHGFIDGEREGLHLLCPLPDWITVYGIGNAVIGCIAWH